jgi:CRP/FNR family cyclic AMP-dependent transcriptional regulator
MSLISLLEEAEVKETVAWKVKKYATGAVIVEENSPGTELFVICKGQVHIVIQVPITADYSEETEVAKLVEGDFFGEIGLFSEELRTASVVAVTDCEVAMVDGAALLDFMDSHPEKGYRIMRHLFEALVERLRLNNIRANTIMGFYKRENG